MEHAVLGAAVALDGEPRAASSVGASSSGTARSTSETSASLPVFSTPWSTSIARGSVTTHGGTGAGPRSRVGVRGRRGPRRRGRLGARRAGAVVERRGAGAGRRRSQSSSSKRRRRELRGAAMVVVSSVRDVRHRAGRPTVPLGRAGARRTASMVMSASSSPAPIGALVAWADIVDRRRRPRSPTFRRRDPARTALERLACGVRASRPELRHRTRRAGQRVRLDPRVRPVRRGDAHRPSRPHGVRADERCSRTRSGTCSCCRTARSRSSRSSTTTETRRAVGDGRPTRCARGTDGARLHGASTSASTSASAPAGACAEHLHVHVVPRWVGDANFMTATANTRTLPEALPDTAAKLRAGWAIATAAP